MNFFDNQPASHRNRQRRGGGSQQQLQRRPQPQHNAQQQHITATTTTTTVNTLVAARASAPASISADRKQLIFCLAQDVSGSMAGSRMSESLKGLDVLHKEVFQPHDLLGVVTFASDVHLLHRPMVVSGLDQNRDKAGIKANVGGSTALYDAIGVVIENIRKDRKDPKHADLHRHAVYELLVITDGEDTCSRRFTLERLSALVAEPGIPNFHLTILGVSMSESEARPIKSQLCAPKHVQYLDVHDASALNEAIRRVAKEVLQRVTVSVVTTTTTTTVRSHGRHGHMQQCPPVAMQQLIQGVQSMAFGDSSGMVVSSEARGPHQHRRPRSAANFVPNHHVAQQHVGAAGYLAAPQMGHYQQPVLVSYAPLRTHKGRVQYN